MKTKGLKVEELFGTLLMNLCRNTVSVQQVWQDRRLTGYQRSDRKSCRNIKCFLLFLSVIASFGANAQYRSQVWSPDNGDGTYTNPVINADYSDPDIEVVGEDYYLTASSFNCMPGLPVLHSKDLVNWEIIGHALRTQFPDSVRTQHGMGVYAPSIRYHNGEFYIYWGDPDVGVFMVKTKDPAGVWSEPVLVVKGAGLIDTTPLWDDDGRCYLVNAWANSRVEFNGVLTVRELSADGTRAIGDPCIVFDGDATGNITTEGPKFYKRDGWYWIFCPAGGVAGGWQLALRSKSPYGPYEWKRVLERGTTKMNGPHQGGWVHTKYGEDWFIHFQDKGLYGRVCHLQPVDWSSGWPVMGNKGVPYWTYKKPKSASKVIVNPVETDEFNSPKLGLQWQWQNDYKQEYGQTTGMGFYRLFTYKLPELGDVKNLWYEPNMLLQKTPADEFTVTTKVNFCSRNYNQYAGLICMSMTYSAICLQRTDSVCHLQVRYNERARNEGAEDEVLDIVTLQPTKKDRPSKKRPVSMYLNDIHLRMTVKAGKVSYAYSLDGKNWKSAGTEYNMSKGRWIGSKIGFFAADPNETGRKGFMDIDYFRVTK